LYCYNSVQLVRLLHTFAEYFFSKRKEAWSWWLMPVILIIQEAEIKRIAV
jgi:hypothetical protein